MRMSCIFSISPYAVHTNDDIIKWGRAMVMQRKTESADAAGFEEPAFFFALPI